MKPLFASAFSDRTSIALQVLGWPVLITLLYQWLAIPEAKAVQLGLSVVLALLLLFLLTYLLALAFTPGKPRVMAALRRVPKLSLLVIVWCAVLFYALRVFDKPSWRWAALAVTLVLFAPLCAHGLAGFRRLRGGQAWAGLAIFAVGGLYVPWTLIWWVPKLAGMNAQAVSAVVRFSLAGILFALAWMTLGSALSVSDPAPPASSEDPAPAAAG